MHLSNINLLNMVKINIHTLYTYIQIYAIYIYINSIQLFTSVQYTNKQIQCTTLFEMSLFISLKRFAY